jgi:hypothetical protein
VLLVTRVQEQRKGTRVEERDKSRGKGQEQRKGTRVEERDKSRGKGQE